MTVAIYTQKYRTWTHISFRDIHNTCPFLGGPTMFYLCRLFFDLICGLLRPYFKKYACFWSILWREKNSKFAFNKSYLHISKTFHSKRIFFQYLYRIRLEAILDRCIRYVVWWEFQATNFGLEFGASKNDQVQKPPAYLFLRENA